jgi:hypothetical protein
MNSLSVPESVDPDSQDVVTAVDYLISGLLHVSPATLRAEYSDSSPSVAWFLDTSEGSTRFHETRKILFRTLLARIGSHYMDSQLYGGKTSTILTQGDNRFRASFDMGNSGSTGYWISIKTENENS